MISCCEGSIRVFKKLDNMAMSTKNLFITVWCISFSILGVPTGSGKTLPQLATILTMKGCAIVIPPLQTIQLQMAAICDTWRIPYVDLSNIHTSEQISSVLEELQPKVILCSIESISNPAIQDQINNLDVAYIAIDECQVILWEHYMVISKGTVYATWV